MEKEPLDIATAFHRIEEAIRPYPKAGLFQLAEEGFTSVFEQLVACILSIRTLDEVMLPTVRKLFEAAPTPEAIRALSVEALDALIHSCTFHMAKAGQIHAIATRTMEEYGGALPCDLQVLLSFSGVGPKCAHLVMGIACKQPYIGVDIHVHRVVNRWGYVDAPTPEATLAALEAKLPRDYWIETNRLLMPFGKFVCTGKRPHCSTCPVLPMCSQKGVTDPR